MAISRLEGPPHSVTLTTGNQMLYQVELSAMPSRTWCAAFLNPPPALVRSRNTPELGRIGLEGIRVTFRATPAQVPRWLRRIDLWIGYANSVVAE